MIPLNLTVEEGRSTQFKCDLAANPPFYYYKYAIKANPPILIENTKNEYPWEVYAINMSSTRIIPNFLAKSDDPFNVSNITRVEFHNVLVCCQGYQSGKWLGNDQNATTALSVMSCYHVDVQCK